MAGSTFPHVPTLGLAMFSVAAILGAMLLCIWFSNRNQRALLYWAAMYILLSVGAGLLARRGVISDFLSIAVANALILLAAGLNWAGARSFEGRGTPVWWYAPPALAWVVACQFAFFAGNINLRAAVVSVVIGAFLFVTGYELWRGRAEKLFARWAAVVVLLAYGTVMLGRGALSFSEPLPDSRALFESKLFATVALGTLLFMNALAFALLALAKERSELQHKRASHIDPLTDLLNRRAFYASSEACFVHQERRKRPLAVLAFDLDRFKQVNDRFGHAVGDSVLEKFSAAVRRELRATDIVGRLGGEEFAALLPDCDEAQAREAAERVRRAFAAEAGHAMTADLVPTVSIGIAIHRDAETLAALLARADKAVYRAKDQGRDCICIASANESAPALVPSTAGERHAAAA